MPIRQSYLDELRTRAEKAKDKKALYGPDIDISRYTHHIERGKVESLDDLSRQAKEAALVAGINLNEEQRSG